MRYELFLRSETPLSEATLAAVAAAGQADGLLVEHFRDGTGVRGVDLGADVDSALAADALPGRAVALAEAHGLVLFDPQLGRVVTAADVPLIRERMSGTQAFAEAALVPGPAIPTRGLTPGMSVGLAVVALVLLVALLNHVASCLV